MALHFFDNGSLWLYKAKSAQDGLVLSEAQPAASFRIISRIPRARTLRGLHFQFPSNAQ
jgi:hypothetical protein